MLITDEMITAAGAVVPSLSTHAVRQMLNAALAGQLVLLEGEGEVVKDGKSTYPDYLVLRVSSPSVALDLAQQLITAVQHQSTAAVLPHPVTLLIAGTASLSVGD